MSSLIERLRAGQKFDSYGARYPSKLDREAADALEAKDQAISMLKISCHDKDAEIERLQAIVDKQADQCQSAVDAYDEILDVIEDCLEQIKGSE